jgi:hypothetical protein
MTRARDIDTVSSLCGIDLISGFPVSEVAFDGIPELAALRTGSSAIDNHHYIV